MRDIVATIQPDQDDLVRAELDERICVQGAPGTGKTAVGLHRAAYLLYTYPERLRRSGVLVVGPNRAFLRYIGEVLPALGEIGVTQTTVDDLLAPVPVRAVDPPAVATLKGDARLAEVLRRAVRRQVRRPEDDVMLIVGTKRYRVPPQRLRRYVDDLRAQRDPVRDGAGAAATARGRGRAAPAGGGRRRPDRRRDGPDGPVVGGARLRRRGVAGGRRRPRCSASCRRPRRARGRGPWHCSSPRSSSYCSGPSRRAAPGPRAGRRLTRCSSTRSPACSRPESYGHVVLDEAQDLSAMQCRGVARRCPLGSVTVLGDLAQATTPWSAEDWHVTLAHLGKTGARSSR